MPSRSQVQHFGAGPALLPTTVLESAAAALLNYQNLGIGICEISHRSPQALQIITDAKHGLTTLLDIPDDYEILFLQGGGCGEFSAVVYHMVSLWVEKRRLRAEQDIRTAISDGKTSGNLQTLVLERLRREVKDELKLDYLVTGLWSLKASQEAARLVGAEHINVASDARETNGGKFGTIAPEEQWKLTPKSRDGRAGSAMVFFCDNETVDGVEFPSFPKCLEAQPDDADAPLVIADMSSNFISRKVDVSKYAVIFGGAQKNIGSTGITIVIVRKSILPPAASLAAPELLRQLNLPVGPSTLDWPTIAKSNSLYNTLPIFDVWIASQVMATLVSKYGAEKVVGQQKVSDQKAKVIYDALEQHPHVYRILADKGVRSRMNICFRIGGGDVEQEKAFLAGAEKVDLLGLRGHRIVGGIRASNYNAVSLEGMHKLAQYLNDFASGQGLGSEQTT